MGKSKNYTFQKSSTLFGEDVIMILRNKDKKHIVSLGEVHIADMIKGGYNPDDEEEMLLYVEHNEYIKS